MKIIVLLVDVAGIVLTGILSWILKETFPSVAGMLGGMSIFLTLGLFIEHMYGHLTTSSVFPKTALLRLGAWPVILLGASTIFLIYGMVSTSFISCFLGTIAFAASFMFALLAVIARNPET